MAFSEFAIYAVFWNGMASIEWKWRLNLHHDGGIRNIAVIYTNCHSGGIEWH